MTSDHLAHLQHRPGTYAAALVDAHRLHAHRPAFVGPDGVRLTYGHVSERAASVLAWLQGLGATPGSRVLMAMDNSIDALLLERAVMLAGLVRVAVSSRLHPRELEWIAEDCAAAVVLVEERHVDDLSPEWATRSFVPAAPGHPRSVDRAIASTRGGPSVVGASGDDAGAIMYTSGTTGRPKGAVTSQAAWLAMAEDVSGLLSATADDVVLHVAPSSHFGGSVAAGFIVRGAAVAAVRRFEPHLLPDQLEAVGATCVPLVPTMLGDLVAVPDAEEAWARSPVRVVPYGGSSIDPQLLSRAVATIGARRLAQFYGASEALIPTLYLSPDDHLRGGWDVVPAGRPNAADQVAIAAPRAPAGDQPAGELVVRGPRVMTGYWGQEGRTREVLEGDGSYHTGDVAQIAADGLVTIVGRTRDVIISGGFNVYPAEVERVIRTVPGVLDVAVVRRPHERWGEAVAAVVVARPGSSVDAAAVIDACTGELASYKKPVTVTFVGALPLTSTGKVDRGAVEGIVEALT